MAITTLARLILTELAGLTDQSQVRAPLLPIHPLPQLPPFHRIKAPPIMVGGGQHTPTSEMGRGRVSSIMLNLMLTDILRTSNSYKPIFAYYIRLPYILAEGITLEEYEERTDKFNIRGLWEWVDYKVIIYEIPTKHHETFITSISTEIMMQCALVRGTDARTRADNSGKEADACFRPSKPLVQSPNGSDGEKEPWPNIVVEVAYSESEQHVLEKVHNYWLRNHSRVHDAIVIKIDPVSEKYEPPTRMQ
ncbi:8176_t:CDS:2, partial [Diversispora eburnea]